MKDIFEDLPEIQHHHNQTDVVVLDVPIQNSEQDKPRSLKLAFVTLGGNAPFNVWSTVRWGQLALGRTM
jgi:hypothetical protein